MERHTIGGLKNTLVSATDFYDIADYFLTLTETNYTAIDGKQSKNKVLTEMIAATVVQICHAYKLTTKSETITLVNLFMIEVRERYFWHGSALINGSRQFILTFFYFSDLDKGLVSVAKGFNNVFARITSKGKVTETNPLEEFSDN